MKKRLLICLIIALLVISACGAGTGDKERGRSKDSVKGFVGGTQAFVLKFTEGAPPKEVFDQASDSFDIEVELDNKGEFDVDGSKVNAKLSGPSPTDWGLSDTAVKTKSSGNVEGVKLDSSGDPQRGLPGYVSFNGLSYQLNVPDGSTRQQDFRVELCYPYENTANVELCILENPRDTRDKVCALGEEKVNFLNSGGVVQLSGVTESYKSDGIHFTFDLSNVGGGNGEVYKKDADCFADSSTLRRSVGVVFVEVDPLNRLSGLKCEFSEKVSETSGYVDLARRGVDCTLPLDNVNTDYTQVIQVKASYQYHDYVEKTINLKG
jgi:hypothetical protein